ncbi:MAG: response regulator [Planctomycetota bacterium]|jgi:two-component system chemotaxis response regulator CheY
MKILAVDDSMTARLMVKNTFEPDGHTVLEAPDGAIALSVLQTSLPVDAVILDWNMPVMNGLECLKQIRMNAVFNDVKVIMCTTEAERTHVVAAVKAGANGYVLKPVDMEQLRAQVVKVCGMRV